MDECVVTVGLCKRYGNETCVDRLSLKVPEGAVYGFLGPNGAGKTTTLKMLLGLVHPSEGSVRMLGHELTSLTRLAVLKEVGSLIESPSYYGHLTARENLEIVRRLRGLPAGEIDEALRTVRLDGQARKPVSHFSLGMKQRLGIAAALMGRPRLLLLDEPTNGLDPSGIQEMRELIRSLPSRYGMTVIVSSHLLGEIDQMADHVGVIRRWPWRWRAASRGWRLLRQVWGSSSPTRWWRWAWTPTAWARSPRSSTPPSSPPARPIRRSPGRWPPCGLGGGT